MDWTQPPSREEIEEATAGSLLGPVPEKKLAQLTGTADRTQALSVMKAISDRGGSFKLAPSGKIQLFGTVASPKEYDFIGKNKDLVKQILTPVGRKPSLYERYVAQPLTQGATRLIGKLEPEAAQRWVSPSTIAKIAVPQTPTAAGTMFGLGLASGAPTILGRLAAAGLGGAAGAGLGGEYIPGGALQGVASQGAGELGGAAISGATRLLMHNPILEKTTADFGESVANALPGIGAVPKTATDLESAFTHGNALEPLRNEMDAVSKQASAAAPGSRFHVPVFVRSTGRQAWAKTSLEDAEKELTNLNDEGWRLDLSGDPRYTQKGRLYRTLAYEARQKIGAELNKTQPGLGDAWLATRKAYSAGRTLQRIFNEPGVFNEETGELDQRVLSKLITQQRPRGYRQELVRNLGKQNADNLLLTIRRGGASGVASDVPGYGARMGVSMSATPHPYIRPPVPPKFVGQNPWYMRPGSYRMPLGWLTSGAIDEEENQ